MTPEERNLIECVFAYGPAALREAGLDDVQAKAFLDRPDVMEHRALLEQEFNLRDAINARVRFNLRRRLSRLGETAVETLERAMSGPEYGPTVNRKTGRPTVIRPGTEMPQVAAAKDVLDRLGVEPTLAERGLDFDLRALFKRKTDEVVAGVEYDAELADPKQQVLSRERVREAMMKLLGEVEPGRKKVLAAVSPARKTRKRKSSPSEA